MGRTTFGRTRQTASVTHLFPALPKLLYVPEPRRKKPQRPSPHGALPDQLVAHMRYEHEVGGVSAAKLAAKYGLSLRRVERQLDYTNRRHIKPLAPPHWAAAPAPAPHPNKTARNKAICAACNGRNYAALASQHGLSEGSVRNIVTAGRRLAVKGAAA